MVVNTKGFQACTFFSNTHCAVLYYKLRMT